ncbi:MAG: Xylose isomerase-like TIM barrel [candidate division BRC1 bacterium ADurb.BinA364]|nr:MAG: Xylose isomerase-like TIM barrel [candidate division BRC1 bacterium ADurb.BinA364]
MYLTGFADEAANDIDGQIRATRELGWSRIEARSASGSSEHSHGVNIHDIPDAEFDQVCAKLAAADVRINCFGSAIANSSTPIDEPFEITLQKVERAIARMKRLNVKLIRIMSYGLIKGQGPQGQKKEERFRRMREFVGRFLDAGIQPVHENCMNYGGTGWTSTLEMLEAVPGLKLVFDTGNPQFTDDWSKRPPYPKQSAWEFYSHVKEHIAYVHIKDGRFVKENPDPSGVFPISDWTWPGEGEGDVRRILKDLLDSGYDGGISIEPHLGDACMDGIQRSPAEAKYFNYVEYGRRLIKILNELGAKL